MASETLEDKKQDDEPDPEVEGKDKEDGQMEVDEKKEESHQLAEKNEVLNESDEPEEKEEKPKDKEEGYRKGKRSRKSSVKKPNEETSESKVLSQELEESKKDKEPEPVTPSNERPTRERKVVERYSAPSSGRSATKPVSIEKVRCRSKGVLMIKLVVKLQCSDYVRICGFSRVVACSLRTFQTVWLNYCFQKTYVDSNVD